MEPADKSSHSKKWIYLLLVGIALLVALISSSSKVRSFFNSNNVQTRQILAKISADFGDSEYVIFKIKTESGIDLEMYEKSKNGRQDLKQKFSFPKDREAFLMVQENPTNLSLADVNKDGQMDVIVPTTDFLGNSRLNVFTFKTDLQQFVPLSAEDH